MASSSRIQNDAEGSEEQIAGDKRTTSPYKGVTFYKRTGRWEANLWFKNRQHYLGSSATALEAAWAYDKAILFTRSSTDQLNFHPSNYAEEMEKTRRMSFTEFTSYLRRKSGEENCEIVNKVTKGLKGIVIDRQGRWEIKYKLKNREKSEYVHLGWFDSEETALRAYNETASTYDGPEATITSFYSIEQDNIPPSATTDLLSPANTDRGNSGLLDVMAEGEPVVEPETPVSTAERQWEVLHETRDFQSLHGIGSLNDPVLCTVKPLNAPPTWLSEILQNYHGEGRVITEDAYYHRTVKVVKVYPLPTTVHPVNLVLKGGGNLSHLKEIPPFDIDISVSNMSIN